MPQATIVVCTRNRASWLRTALASLIDLEKVNLADCYEVLVINNGSTDDTSAVVQEIASTSPVAVREVIEERPGIVFARNRGVREANGEWIAFFDDDQIADSRWLIELLNVAKKKSCRCVGGAVTLKLPPGDSRMLSPICRMLLGETVGMDSPRCYNVRITPGAGNLMVHRTVFEQIGTFDEAFQNRGEDTDLFLRMHAAGIEAWFTPTAIVHHVIPADRLSPAYLLKISELMSQGIARQERDSVGRWAYPAYWLGRLGQAALSIGPRLIWTWILNQRENQLGYRCRLRIAKGYLREGFPLMFQN